MNLINDSTFLILFVLYMVRLLIYKAVVGWRLKSMYLEELTFYVYVKQKLDANGTNFNTISVINWHP